MSEDFPEGMVLTLQAFSKIDFRMLPDDILMKRHDRKFLCHRDEISGFLEILQSNYQIVTAAGESISPYSSQYIDTDDLSFFKAHHAGKGSRAKVRLRRYPNTVAAFIEVKLKNNKGLTRKERASVAYTDDYLSENVQAFLSGYFATDTLKRFAPTAAIHYHRIGLIDHDLNERVSIDFNISTNQDDRSANFGEVAIIEVKTDAVRSSPAVAALRSLSIRQFSFSKYCLSMSILHKNLKSNAFKPNLHYLQKIDHAFTF